MSDLLTQTNRLVNALRGRIEAFLAEQTRTPRLGWRGVPYGARRAAQPSR